MSFIELKTSFLRGISQSPEQKVAKENLVCLTGNDFEWAQNQKVFRYNRSPGGTYRYMNPPDGIPDRTGSRLSFGSGKLTDRLNAAEAFSCVAGPMKNRSRLEDWVVSWKNLEPVSLLFEFKQPVKMSRLRCFFHGELPPFEISVSENGTDFQKIKSFSGKISGKYDAPGYTADFPSVEGRFLRLDFARRNQALTIGEIDIWGEFGEKK